MTRSQKILVAIIVGAVLISASWFVLHKEAPPQDEGEVFKRAYLLEKWGRYDSAVNVFQSWMSNSRRDVSKDDFLYQQIAMIYIMKARRKPAYKNDSIAQANANLEKALSSYDSHLTKDVDVMLFEIGGTYEMLGDLTNSNKCQFYKTAELLFVRQLPLLKGDSFVEYGHTFDLRRARSEVNRHLESVREKSSKDGC